MGELDPDQAGTDRLHVAHDVGPGALLPVVPQAGATMGDPRLRHHTGCLRDDDAGPRDRERAEMLAMPGLRHAIDGGVLAHRRHRDAVGRRHGPELQRGEEKRAHRKNTHVTRRKQGIRIAPDQSM